MNHKKLNKVILITLITLPIWSSLPILFLGSYTNGEVSHLNYLGEVGGGTYNNKQKIFSANFTYNVDNETYRVSSLIDYPKGTQRTIVYYPEDPSNSLIMDIVNLYVLRKSIFAFIIIAIWYIYYKCYFEPLQIDKQRKARRKTKHNKA
jgi:hypothetical protein